MNNLKLPWLLVGLTAGVVVGKAIFSLSGPSAFTFRVSEFLGTSDFGDEAELIEDEDGFL